ncbi:hypothetical protein TrRE_jg284 [Triparma retinervis]|uniref:Uncharacterized protein n=1 Tax=Triparma retinervis TaxID=2557542 RepID=A0A9W6ZJI9_9STRA|nr:hypothetical protein TrRE_jg284 [Triparma retinervis]
MSDREMNNLYALLAERDEKITKLETKAIQQAADFAAAAVAANELAAAVNAQEITATNIATAAANLMIILEGATDHTANCTPAPEGAVGNAVTNDAAQHHADASDSAGDHPVTQIVKIVVFKITINSWESSLKGVL